MKNLVVDWEKLGNNFDSDKFTISLVVEAFLSSIDGILAKVRTAVASNDPQAIALSAHSLKGAILNFGAKEAVALAQELENQGYEGLKDNVNDIFKSLDAAVAVIVAELRTEASRYQDAS